MSSPVPDRIVDARGHRCPVPTLRLRRALEQAEQDAVIELLADDPLARIDIPHLLAALGYPLLKQACEGATLRFLVLKRPAEPEAQSPSAP
jgi:tRNA 2-thiouridine synthesizing protein A